MLLLAADADNGPDQCVSIPQVIHAYGGDVLVFFSPHADATVEGLNSTPIIAPPASPKDLKQWYPFRKTGDDPVPLTPVASLDVDKGVVAKIRINEDAKGTYELAVECGDFPDDPPKVVVW